MSDIGNKPLGSDWTAFLPKQMMPVANLLAPQLEVAAAVSVASTEIATRMFGIWTNAMLGSFDLKATGLKQTAPIAIADLKAVIREKAGEAAKPSKPVQRNKNDVIANPLENISSAATENLKKISGIGPKLEQVLNSMGIRSYAQIAAWTTDDIAKVDKQLKLNGRISRDDWVGQANRFVSEVK